MIILGSIFSIITIKWTLLEYLETTFGELRSLGGGLRDLNRSPKIVKKGHFWYIQGGTLGCDNLCAGFYVENRSCRSNFPSANLVLGFNQAREGSTDGLKSPTDLLLLGTSCLSTSYVPFRLNCNDTLAIPILASETDHPVTQLPHVESRGRSFATLWGLAVLDLL